MKSRAFRLSLATPIVMLLAALAVMCGPTDLARAASGDLSVYTSTIPGPQIPDNQCASGTYVSQTVTVDSSFPISKVRVGINLTHTARNDLIVQLTAPDGFSAAVVNRVFGSYDNLDILLDDAASAAPGGPPGWLDHITDPPYYDYTWRPSTPLSLFRHRDAAGTWQLSACDAVNANQGQMNFFSLFLEEGAARPAYVDSSVSATPGAPLLPGSVTTFTVSIANNGTLTGNAMLANPIPAGAAYIANSAAVEPAGHGTLIATSGDVQWSGSVAPRQKVTVTFRAAVVAVSGWITNTATISDPLTEAPVTQSVGMVVAAPAYAGSSKSVSPLTSNQLLPGQTATYTIVISNSGIAAGAASLLDPLPEGVAYVPGSAVASSGPPPGFDGANITWAGPVGVGQRVSITFQVSVLAVNGSITNTAIISDPALTAPIIRSIGRSVAAPVLSASALSADRSGAPVGGRFTYTLAIRNSGLVSTTAAIAQVELPAGVLPDPSGMGATSGSAVAAGSRVTWTGRVSAGGVVTITLPVTASDWCGTLLTVTATISDRPLLTPVTLVAPVVQTYERLIVNEAFEGGAFPPVGWVVTGTGGNCAWAMSTSNNQTGGSGSFANANSIACNVGSAMTTELRTPAFSLAGAVAPALEFKYDYRHAGSQSASVDISENGPAGPWITLWARNTNDRGPQTALLNLAPYAGQPNLMIRFRFLSPVSNQWWQVDDVRVMEICPVSIGPSRHADRCRGSVATHTLSVANTAATSQTIHIAALNAAWPTLIEPSSIQIEPFASRPVTVTVRVPWEAPGSSDMATILATGTQSGAKGVTTLRTSAAGICRAWQELPPSPRAAQGPGVAYHNGYVYQFGGKDASGAPTNGAFRYHIASGVWETLTNMIEAVWAVDVAAINDNLYVFGGAINSGGSVQTKGAQVYSTVTGQWSRVADMFTPVAFHRTVALSGNLHVLGGYSGLSTITSTWVYYPGSNSWGPGAPLSSPRRSAAAGVVGGQIYLAGGHDGITPLGSMEVYSPALTAWLPGPALPHAMSEPADAVLGGRYLILAGGRITSAVTARVIVYDALSGAWSALPDLGAPRQSAGADSDGTTLFMAGGAEFAGASSYSSARHESTVLCVTCYPQDSLPLAPTFTHTAIAPPWPVIQFTSVAIGAPPLVFSWDFGDGTQAYAFGDSIVHTYTQGGLYRVVMTASNACGSTTYSQTVLVAAHGLDINPPAISAVVDTANHGGAPAITHTLRVTNTGNISDTILLTASGAWTTTVTPTSTDELGPGEGAPVDVRVQILVPPNAVSGTRDVALVTATSARNPGVHVVAALTTTAVGCQPISAVSLWQQPGGQIFSGGLARFRAVAAGAPPFQYRWFVDGFPADADTGELDFTPFAMAPGARVISVTVANACSHSASQTTATVNAPAQSQPDLSPSALAISQFSDGLSEVITHAIILRNQSSAAASAVVGSPIPDQTTLVTGSLSPGMLILGNQVYWSGQVISGTPVTLQYAVTVSNGPPWGQPITHSANINNGLGNEIALQSITPFAPGAWLRINNGEPHTRNPVVTLTVHAPVGAAHVQFSNDAGFSLAGGISPILPVSAASPTNWRLATAGQQVVPRTVYARFRDAAGYWMAPVIADDILLDTESPSIIAVQVITGAGSAGIAADATGLDTAQIVSATLRVTAGDSNTGVSEIWVSNQPGCAGATVYPATGVTTMITGWNLPPGGVHVCAVDRTGNVSAPHATAGGPGFRAYLPAARR